MPLGWAFFIDFATHICNPKLEDPIAPSLEEERCMFFTERRTAAQLNTVSIVRTKIYALSDKKSGLSRPFPFQGAMPCHPSPNPSLDPMTVPVQFVFPHPTHSLPAFPSTHVINSFALLAISNASGGRPFTKMPQSLSSSMSSPSLPLSSSLSTHSDRLSTSFCTDCSLGEASCVLAIICEVVDTMAARWSRMSGASADVRMEEIRAWMEGIRWSVRDSRKVCLDS